MQPAHGRSSILSAPVRRPTSSLSAKMQRPSVASYASRGLSAPGCVSAKMSGRAPSAASAAAAPRGSGRLSPIDAMSTYTVGRTALMAACTMHKLQSHHETGGKTALQVSCLAFGLWCVSELRSSWFSSLA